MSILKRFSNMAKWLIVFFDTIVYFTLAFSESKEVVMPLSSYFMVDTKYDVTLMTDAQKLYVGRQIAGIGLGSMLGFFAAFLGLFGSFGPDDDKNKIKLPGF